MFSRDTRLSPFWTPSTWQELQALTYIAPFVCCKLILGRADLVEVLKQAFFERPQNVIWREDFGGNGGNTEGITKMGQAALHTIC